MRFHVALMAVLLLSRSGNAQTPEATLREWGKLLEALKFSEVVALYESSDRVLALESDGLVRKKIEGIRAMYRDVEKEVTAIDKIALEGLEVRQKGDVAWAVGRLRADLVMRGDGGKWTLTVHATFVLERKDNGWKIVLEHFSPIRDVPRLQKRCS